MARGRREKKPEVSLGKKVFRVILGILGAAVLVVGVYVAYVFISYDRLEDNLELEINNPVNVSSNIPVGEELKVTSWNIGFAAYLQDYTFFMDGGKESRARSKEAVEQSMSAICDTLHELESDLYLIQEVDFDATRTYKVDERKILTDSFPDYSSTFAQNYDSPYLFWPLLEPHGANKAGILTLSDYSMTTSIRRSLPIQTDLAKFLDLDRCYDLIRIPADNGKDLVLINLHLSAYTTDSTIADQQLDMIYEQIVQERINGNYVICGGDFNKDLIGDGGKCFGVEGGKDYSWCQPFKEENLPEGFTLVKPYDPEENIASNRVANEPYNIETTFRTTLDGFIVSDNVKVIRAKAIEEEFKYSDHNPVQMSFKLEK